jgi:hypothetical protein
MRAEANGEDAAAGCADEGGASFAGTVDRCGSRLTASTRAWSDSLDFAPKGCLLAPSGLSFEKCFAGTKSYRAPRRVIRLF